MLTIEQAKEDIRQGWKTPTGAKCPCCGQKVKAYDRKLTGTMAAGLIRLVKKSETCHRYHHITELNVSSCGGEFAQLKRWGLIEAEINDNTRKRVSGKWKPTSKGIDFVYNRIKVPAYCETYNMRTLGFSDEETTIRAALGKKFDYTELMGYLI